MKLSTQIILAFTLIILLSAADSYTNYRLSLKVNQNSEFLSKSEAVIRNSNKTHRAILQMQNAVRGYLLTNDTTYLAPYYSGIEKVPDFFVEQHTLIDSNTIQSSILDSISILHSEWLSFTSELIRARRENPKTYQYLLDTKLKKHIGKNINDSITKKFKRFEKIEYKTRAHHSEMLLHSLNKARSYSLVFLSLTIFVGICSTTYIVIMITKRINSMVRVADTISKGRFTIVRDFKNDELSALAASLNIMSRRLEKNIQELENKNEELNKFAYVVSHDLKAPLRGIYNVISWIEEDLSSELSPALRNYLNIIPKRTQRMEALINGLLDYARINRKTSPEIVDTNTLVQEIAQSIVPREFKLEIINLPELVTERLKLEQVFSNLISNAVKYSKPENPYIEIKCQKVLNYYEFSVTDNGIGIDEEYHQKIFEIFQTLREKNEMESTGVGLAIVKKIIDDQGESIHVESKLGEGTKFTFTWRNNKQYEKA
ncbi:HAMP domain-containing protein [Flavobacterium resistens]|uniref:histidine kinase n=1 Tax=Flavobacterium resistens TaxID=443612 RepID=A0A521AQZ4_9FLAO|nr:ATP-binding protein [Flavobacterium resistens]MRX69760.1 HAMP domain-containing protein [Flavobacterium resistens]SMO37232.1 HAMP domain-containing protein [Flavobacterium resistens]